LSLHANLVREICSRDLTHWLKVLLIVDIALFVLPLNDFVVRWIDACSVLLLTLSAVSIVILRFAKIALVHSLVPSFLD
jgi:hypothetical protein